MVPFTNDFNYLHRRGLIKPLYLDKPSPLYFIELISKKKKKLIDLPIQVLELG